MYSLTLLHTLKCDANKIRMEYSLALISGRDFVGKFDTNCGGRFK
jgi:hypothetical protein